MTRTLHPEEEPPTKQGCSLPTQPLRKDPSTTGAHPTEPKGFRQEVCSPGYRRQGVLGHPPRCLGVVSGSECTVCVLIYTLFALRLLVTLCLLNH